MVLWKDYIEAYVRQKIKQSGGVNACGRKYGINPALISKMSNGIYIPKRNTLSKMFKDDYIPETIEIIKET
jgi:hypothetical protein